MLLLRTPDFRPGAVQGTRGYGARHVARPIRAQIQARPAIRDASRYHRPPLQAMPQTLRQSRTPSDPSGQLPQNQSKDYRVRLSPDQAREGPLRLRHVPQEILRSDHALSAFGHAQRPVHLPHLRQEPRDGRRPARPRDAPPEQNHLCQMQRGVPLQRGAEKAQDDQ